jgi:AraC family transcriptional regulator, arabinose operon regulatory protein
MRSFKLFPKGYLFKTKDLEVRALGLRERMPACVIDRPGGRPDYLFMYFETAARIGDGPRAKAWPGRRMRVWAPGEAQYYGNAQDGFTHSWVHCSGMRVELALKRSNLPLGKVFEMPDGGAVDRHVEMLHDELAQQARPEGVIVGNLLENMMMDLARLARGEGRGRMSAAVAACKRIIEAEYDRALSLDELAGRVGLSVSHLCALFKAHLGVGVIGYLIQVRIGRAAALLGQTDLKVAQVGQMVGYADVFHFSKLFKKQLGRTPGEFRRKG